MAYWVGAVVIAVALGWLVLDARPWFVPWLATLLLAGVASAAVGWCASAVEDKLWPRRDDR